MKSAWHKAIGGGDVMPLLLCTTAVSHPRASSADVSPVSGTLHLTAKDKDLSEGKNETGDTAVFTGTGLTS